MWTFGYCGVPYKLTSGSRFSGIILEDFPQAFGTHLGRPKPELILFVVVDRVAERVDGAYHCFGPCRAFPKLVV